MKKIRPVLEEGSCGVAIMRRADLFVAVKYVGVVGWIVTTATAILGMGMMGKIRKLCLYNGLFPLGGPPAFPTLPLTFPTRWTSCCRSVGCNLLTSLLQSRLQPVLSPQEHKKVWHSLSTFFNAPKSQMSKC